MFAMHAAKHRCVFTVWTERRSSDSDASKVWVASEVFEQYFQFKETVVVAALGVGSLEANLCWTRKKRIEWLQDFAHSLEQR